MANKIGEENKTLGPTKGIDVQIKTRDVDDDEDAIKCLGKHQTRGK